MDHPHHEPDRQPFVVNGIEPRVYYFDTEDGITLTLTRYTQGTADNAVILSHGLTTSSLMYSLPEHHNLTSFLLDEGFGDIWLPDIRISSRMPYLREAVDWTFDDVVLFDVPAAVAEVRRHIGDKPLHILANCIGGITSSSALAAGLIQPTSITLISLALVANLPAVGKAKLMLMPDLLKKFIGKPYLPIEIEEVGILSRAGTLMGLAGATRRFCGSPTCHTVNFMWGGGRQTAFRHDNLHPDTHKRLNQLYGPVPFCYWDHLRRIVAAGVSVRFNETDPLYKSLPENYFEVAGQIQTPMFLLSGGENECWGDSCRLCYEMLKDYYPHLDVCYEEIPGYGHLDVIFGRNAAIDVFPQISSFMRRCEEEQCARKGSVPVTY